MASGSLRTVVAAMRAASRPSAGQAAAGAESRPFITIARQAGAGGTTLARKLCDRLNTQNRSETKWEVYDKQLVEQIAEDERVSAALVDALEDESRNWLTDLANGLSFSSPSEEHLFRKLSALMRALAERGHVVLVGRGGVFVTNDLPGGTHLYLVAPLEHRIRHYAATANLDHDEARRRVAQLDENRAAFYRRFHQQKDLSLEMFDAVLNTARLDEQTQLEIIEGLVHSSASHRRR